MSSDLKVMYASILPERIRVRVGWGEPAFWNFLIFGAPVWLLFNYYFFTHTQDMDGGWMFRVSLYLGGTCVWAGPLLNLVWERAFEKFYRKLNERSASEGWSIDAIETFRLKMDRQRYLFSGFFILILCVAAIAALAFLPAFFATSGWSDPFHWVIILVAVAVGYTGGIGLWGVLKTIGVVALASRTGIQWNPFHEDGLGGLQFIGDFSLITTLLFSAGTLAIPLSIEITNLLDGVAQLVVGAAPLVFSIGIAASFMVPTFAIGRLAQVRKMEFLRRVRNRLDRSLDQVLNHTPSSEEPEFINTAISLYDRVQQTRLSVWHPYHHQTRVVGYRSRGVVYSGVVSKPVRFRFKVRCSTFKVQGSRFNVQGSRLFF